ncbi:MAG: RsmD family RNA methyltransferase [Muribaculaceae bacterium]|nr:RsmD family RNA methyltransferase [Muribaculaceae bacterium]
MYFQPDQFYAFIKQYSSDNPMVLRLSKKKLSKDFDFDFAVTQIENRQKTKSKLASFLEYDRFLFPDLISGEQASHQAIASYHSSLLTNEQSILDMTAGLGIDSLSFAKKNIDVTSIELDAFKAEILRHNSEVCQRPNITVINADSLNFLKETSRHFDAIFVDPSRRNENKRIYNLRDCAPDILTNQDLLLNKANRVIIKASPLLDITQTLKDFQNVSSIKAVGVKGECKELLIELRKNAESFSLEAINLDNDGNIISSISQNDDPGDEKLPMAAESDFQEGIYLLEPSAIVMKIAPWKNICQKYNAKKLDSSSHLFITPDLPFEFPGRVTLFEHFITKKERKSLKGFPASVISRNYPVTSDDLRKSLQLKEGDSNFIYATRIASKPSLLLTKI